MKKSILISLFAIIAMCVLVFSGCDWLFGDDNNGDIGSGSDTCTHIWVWKTETPATEETDGLRTEYCSKCKASGRTQIIPAGTESDDNGNIDFDISDDELEKILSSPETKGLVGPLLTTKWAQRDPFNDLFPIVYGHAKANASGVFPTDCTITATAQIIAFHKPARGTGQSTMISPQGVTVPLVDLSATYYDWDNMLNHYRSDGTNSTERQRNAVATLMYHVAAARGASDLRLLYPNHFGFDRSVQIHGRSYYTDTEWEDMIRQQLDAGLPVFYYGNDPQSGHGFVVDGYDDQGRFHVNWGWRGAGDGWYSLDNLNPPIMGRRSFYNNQSITINIKPDQGSIGSNEFGLITFSTDKISAAQNELLTVNFNVRSFGYFPGGQVGAALVDNNGKIVEVIGTRSRGTLNPNSRWVGTLTINCIIPETVPPREDYQLMIVTKMEGGEWKPVTLFNREAEIPNAIPVTITAGQANSGGYEQALTNFTTTAGSSVPQNELFTVTFATRNLSSDIYPGGLQGAALVDENNNIAAVIGSVSRGALNPDSSRILTTINCTVPNNVPLGDYRLRIVIRRIDNEEWKIATLSLPDIPNAIPITIIAGQANSGGYGQALTSFTTTSSSVSYNEQFTVSFATRNISPDTYPGGLQGAALVDKNDNIVAVIRSVSRSALNSGSTRILTNLNCTVPNTVPSGQYRLRIVINRNDNEEWRIATMSVNDVPTSYDFEVK